MKGIGAPGSSNIIERIGQTSYGVEIRQAIIARSRCLPPMGAAKLAQNARINRAKKVQYIEKREWVRELRRLPTSYWFDRIPRLIAGRRVKISIVVFATRWLTSSGSACSFFPSRIADTLGRGRSRT
jgi:hypothetical protein